MSPPLESSSPLPGLDNAQRVQIANLVPQDLASSTSYIEAQVVLVWPYSSSTRQFAFLLSEPDAHPLKSGRQVKIAFYNGAARAVQTSKVGIGDRIRLVLRGCHLQDSQDPTATPGKRIKWDLIYRKAIALEVKQTSSDAAHIVNYESTGTPSPRTSPLTNGTVQRDSNHRDHSLDLTASFKSPASRRTSGIHSYIAAPNDPFIEDIEQESGRSRKRTKFARPSGSWRLLDDDLDGSPAVPSSPLGRQDAIEEGSQKAMNEDAFPATDQSPSIDETNKSTEATPGTGEGTDFLGERQLAQQASGAAHHHSFASSMLSAAVSAAAMGPPTTPVRPRPDMRLQLSSEQDLEPEAEATTPRLHPLSSRGLPLISPLLKTIGVETGYFPDATGQSSELDAISHPATESRTADSVASEGSQHGLESDEVSLTEEQAETTTRPFTLSDDTQGLEERQQTTIVIEDEDEEAIETVESKDFGASTLIASRSDETDVTAVPLSEAANASKVADHRRSRPGTEESPSKSPLVSPKLPDHPVLAEATSLESQMRHEKTVHSGPSNSQQAIADIPSVESLDGTFDLRDDTIPEHVLLLQGNFERRVPKLLDMPGSRVTRSAEAAELQNETPAQSFTDEASQLPMDQDVSAAKDIDSGDPPTSRQDPVPPASQEQLMTPAQTQDMPQTTEVREHMPAIIAQQEPLTPQATQTEGEMAPFEETAKAERAVITDTKNEGEVPGQPVPSTSRRVSQRLNRKSEAPASIESPFFTRREALDEDEAPGIMAVDKSSPQSAKQRARQSKTPEPKPEQTNELASEKGKGTAISKGTNTALAYYPSLSQLHEYYGQIVDIVAVCAETTPDAVQAKSGPHDWHTTLRLVDPDTTDAKTTVQVFRPYKQALPSAQLGDIVILRNFKVQTAKRKWTLLSTESSAWAVFKSNPESRSMFDDVKMTGPHLEYGRGETAHVKELVQWYTSKNRATFPPRENPSIPSRRPAVITNIDQPFAEASVLESVEQATSPRRSRRLRSEAGRSPEPESQTRDTNRDAAAVTETGPPQNEAKQRTRTKTPTSPQVRPPAPSSSIGPAASDTSSLPPLSPRYTRRRTRSTLSPAVSFSAVGSASAASSIAATSPTEVTFGAQRKNKGKGKAKPMPKAREKTPQQPASEETQSKGQQEQPRRSMRARSARANSPPVVHELRDGMRYTDDKDPEAPPKRATRSMVHELRDGNRYVDEAD